MKEILYRALFEKQYSAGLWAKGEVILMQFDHSVERKTEGLNKGPYNVMKLI